MFISSDRGSLRHCVLLYLQLCQIFSIFADIHRFSFSLKMTLAYCHWLMLIDADWLWWILIDGDADAVTPSSNTRSVGAYHRPTDGHFYSGDGDPYWWWQPWQWRGVWRPPLKLDSGVATQNTSPTMRNTVLHWVLWVLWVLHWVLFNVLRNWNCAVYWVMGIV